MSVKATHTFVLHSSSGKWESQHYVYTGFGVQNEEQMKQKEEITGLNQKSFHFIFPAFSSQPVVKFLILSKCEYINVQENNICDCDFIVH